MKSTLLKLEFLKPAALSLLATLLLTSISALANPPATIVGLNLTEDGGSLTYDAAPEGQPPTEAQKRILQIKEIGAKHVILNVRGKMVGGTSNEVTSFTPPAKRTQELTALIRLMKFAKAQGLTVGIRPIFFVVGPNGEFPYTETLADGSKKNWWHGNIQPADPNRWFESFRTFLEPYINVAKAGGADEFTIGAELYSMTVGIEDQWKAYPYGFPGRWKELLDYTRGKLPNVRLMYDINFTDDSANDKSGLQKAGGELERWRYRLVDLASSTKPEEQEIYKTIVEFWKGLDGIGIDMYRSFVDDKTALPTDEAELTKVLRIRADAYASQLQDILFEISLALGVEKPVYLKEVGFRSAKGSLVNPYAYTKESEAFDDVEQAAGYAALMQAFWDPKFPWFAGVNFWDVSVDPSKQGPSDVGFSPFGKPATEKVLRSYTSQ